MAGGGLWRLLESANETDMLMRNTNTGAFEVYDISNNTITLSTGMGQIGWSGQIAGFGDFCGNANETDMLMRNSHTGMFELYDIGNNTVTLTTAMGQVGLEWSISGVSANPASAPPNTHLSGIAVDPAGSAPAALLANSRRPWHRSPRALARPPRLRRSIRRWRRH